MFLIVADMCSLFTQAFEYLYLASHMLYAVFHVIFLSSYKTYAKRIDMLLSLFE